MLLSMLSTETKADVERAQFETSTKLIDGDRLTEAGIAWLTDQVKIVGIDTPAELEELARELGVRPDWHEPDEQDVSARIRGHHLDNAMGSTMRDLGEDNESGEFNIVIQKDGRDRAVINLATLLSWACGYGRA